MREGFLFNGAGFQRSDDWDLVERDFIAKIMPRFDLFLNVGAHYGFYCCLARNLDLPIIALEPIDANFQTLMRNLKHNGFQDKATLFHAAAGPEPTVTEISGGFATATLRSDHHHPRGQTQLVPMLPIDTVVPDEAGRTLVLMDVEGFELQALRGARTLLSHNHKTAWIVEIFPSWVNSRGQDNENQDYFETFGLMFDCGYNAWWIEGAFERVTRDSLSAWMADPALKRAGGNFLFASGELGDELLSLSKA